MRPDNVLFEVGGAGEGIRKRLERGDFHDFIRCYHERQQTERFRRWRSSAA